MILARLVRLAYSYCMAAPGWYQDPDGSPGQYRWWDGSVWTERVRDEPPPQPEPAASDPKPPSAPGRPARRTLPIAIGVAVVVVALVVAFVWAQQSAGPDDPGLTSAPTVSHSGWNELPETASPSAPTSSPSSNPTGLVPCKKSSHFTDPPTPQTDGWLTSGALSVKSMGGEWMSAIVELPSAYDNAAEIQFISPGWTSNSSVAQLSKDDGFADPESAAEYMMDCVARSDYYHGFTSREDLSSQAMTIDGHAAWHRQANVYVEDPEAPEADGDVVDVITVDLGASLGVYVSGCTIGDEQVCAQVREAIKTLKVSQ